MSGAPEIPAPDLRANGLVKSYRTGRIEAQVLKGVDFAARHGDVTMVMGPSGSGKSTMVAALSGLMRPDAGEVTALGQNLWKLSPGKIDKFRLDHCGFIFQGFNLFAALTALQQVTTVLKYTGLGGEEARSTAEQALGEVGLSKRLHLRPSELSGGEKQRVAIARAISKRPEAPVRRRTDVGARQRKRPDRHPASAARRKGARRGGDLRHPRSSRLEDYADRDDPYRGRPDHRCARQSMRRPPPKPSPLHPQVPGSLSPCPPSSAAPMFWIVIVLVLAGAGACVFMGRQAAAKKAAEEKTAAASLASTPYAGIASGKADVEGGIIQVAARTAGVIRTVSVQEGDKVTKGEVLAQLEDDQPRLAVANAAAAVRQAQAQIGLLQVQKATAERELARLQPLKAKAFVAGQALDNAADAIKTADAQLDVQRAAVNSAEAALNVASYQLELTRVRAPSDGRIVRRYANPGAGASTLNVSNMFDLEPNNPASSAPRSRRLTSRR